MDYEPTEGSAAVGEPPELEPRLPTVPSPLAQKILLFEFLVLIEYWLSPLLFGVENYAGLWSSVGYLLFVVFAASLIGLVVVPLRAHLREALRAPHRRLAFHAAWAGAILLGLFATNTIQFAGGAGAGSTLQWTTVYTPFGPYPSLTFVVPALDLTGSLNIEVVTILGLVAVLWAASLVLGPLRPATACPRPAANPTGWRARLAPLAAWGPFGLISGCPSCLPAYVSVAALISPGAATSGFAAIPLVPWIGLAGLLYLASLGVTILVLRRSTAASEPTPSPDPWGVPT